MLIATGWGSAIVRALLPMLPHGEEASRAVASLVPLTAERYLFCAGVMRPKRLVEQSDDEIAETIQVNTTDVMRACDRLIEGNAGVRICIVGSESGFSGSYDGAYAVAKAAVHRYVETRRLASPDQQLVAVAPGIVEDAGMTLRRQDHASLAERAAHHPKGRFLRAAEVARLIRFLLYEDGGYISGVVVRMNGGEHTCR